MEGWLLYCKKLLVDKGLGYACSSLGNGFLSIGEKINSNHIQCLTLCTFRINCLFGMPTSAP